MNFVKVFKDKDFIKFKKECSKMGTTEEALANAEKLGFDTNLFAEHPFIKGKKTSNLCCKFCFDGLRTRRNFWVSST